MYQGPRKDRCRGCLAPETFCDMCATGAMGARFLLIFLNFHREICYVVIITQKCLKNQGSFESNTRKSMHNMYFGHSYPSGRVKMQIL